MAADDTVTENNLGDKILDAAKTSLGSRFTSVKTFAKAEAEKLAINAALKIVKDFVNGKVGFALL